jgi:hypothetical protein
MGLRADYVAAVAQALTDAGETGVAVFDRWMSPIPSTPCVTVVPGDPYLIPYGNAGYKVQLDAVLWLGRLDSETVMAQLDRLLPIVTSTAPAAELRYRKTDVGVQSSAGVDYVTARNLLQGESTNP